MGKTRFQEDQELICELRQKIDSLAHKLEEAERALHRCSIHSGADVSDGPRTKYEYVLADVACLREEYDEVCEEAERYREALEDQRRRWNRHSTRLTMAGVNASGRDMDDAVNAIEEALGPDSAHALAENRREAREPVCSPLCGASKAYGRFVKPWQHEPECPVRLDWERKHTERGDVEPTSS